MQNFNVNWADMHRVEINFTYKPEQHLLWIGERRRFRIGKHAIHEFDGSHYSSDDGRMTS